MTVKSMQHILYAIMKVHVNNLPAEKSQISFATVMIRASKVEYLKVSSVEILHRFQLIFNLDNCIS